MKCRHLSAAGLFLSTSFASAAAAAATSEPVPKQINFLEVLHKGGPMMYPLGVMSVIMVLLILLFLLTVRRNVIVSDRFMNAAEAMIRKRDYLGLMAFSQRRNECMARITQKTLEFMAGNPSSAFENIRDAAQTEGSRQAGMLTSRITYLADLGSLAPMVGLLGTVMGMTKTFTLITVFGTGNAAKLSSGIEIGQTVVVKEGTILAVEAFEGTDDAILRAGRLGGRGSVVVKVAKRGHDMRFDIPVIGLRTLKSLRKARAAVLAVEAGRTILLERAKLAAEADRIGLSLVAVETKDHES